MTTPVEELKDVIEAGLVSDIFRMERAYALFASIGERSQWLNQPENGNFGELFGAFQIALQTEAILSVARVYDKPSGKYPTRCIPKALQIIEERTKELPEITEPHNTKVALGFLGKDSSAVLAVDQGRDAMLAEFIPAFRKILDSKDVKEGVASLKCLRDKNIAHNENAQISGPTWTALKDLIILAQNFVGVVGWAFFNTCYVHANTVDIHPADPNINRCARIGASPTSTSRERGGTGRSGGSGAI